jgi:antirestriction protein ArdC
VRPWKAGASVSRPLRGNGVPYRGINVVTLWMAAAAKGYSSPYWMTFRQAHEYGAHVRRGERATIVVYASRFTKAEAGKTEK